MKLLSLLITACLLWAAPALASAQTYNLTSNFGNGSGTVSGAFTYDPVSSTVTSATVSVGAGNEQLGGPPISGATYSTIAASSTNFLEVRNGPAAPGARGIEIYFSPDLPSGAPSVFNHYEYRCTGACTGKTFTRQVATGASVTQVPSVSGLTPNSGPVAGGTLVTLTGTGFTAATAVTFGGTAATNVTVVSATQITARSPAAGAGVADVAVTGPGGTSANTPADNFTYVAGPAPVPTMSEWAMILLGTILAGGAALIVQRRQLSA
ncbi:IPTL-CTERM sorting domain-containing protein [Brevundimonas sp.]|uniref:IPTL-CTERM sorting domain-containing protein n=1 Tax=Brevundimonas sp. TaxID=1871086 RepID=UPI003D0A9197